MFYWKLVNINDVKFSNAVSQFMTRKMSLRTLLLMMGVQLVELIVMYVRFG